MKFNPLNALFGSVVAALFCGISLFAAESALDLDPNMKLKPENTDGLKYLIPAEKPLRLSGFCWYDTDHVYRRLPLRPDGKLSRGVELLAWNTAGGQVAFRSDTGRIVLKVKMRSNNVMYHMAQTGTAGFDLYAGPPGRQRFFGVTRFPAGAKEYTARLFQGERRMRDFTINFPLYAGVDQVFIGVDADAEVEAPPAWEDDRPIVIYGTSITQGGCASRPGMAYTNLLSRRLNRPVVNLGFSGNGKGEPEVAAEIAKIENPACFILDYEANVHQAKRMRDTLTPFIGILRKNHPDVPILLLSKVRYAYEGRDLERGNDLPRPKSVQAIQAEEHAAFEKLSREDANLHFLSGDDLLGADFDECSVDGVHPTDLGFYRMAEKLEPAIRQLLRK